MLPAARSYIRHISHSIVLHTRTESNAKILRHTKATAELFQEMLPNLRSVTVSVSIITRIRHWASVAILASQITDLVETGIVEMLTPFRQLSKMIVNKPKSLIDYY